MMHFIFTTVALHLLNSQILAPHYERSALYYLSSEYRLAMFYNARDGLNKVSPSLSKTENNVLQAEDVTLACSTLQEREKINGDESFGETSRLLQEYINFRRRASRSPSTWVANKSKLSCSLFDQKHHLVFLFGDIIGAFPLWYELRHSSDDTPSQIFASSDPLLATPLGFHQMTPVGPGLTLSIDVSASDSFEVINCKHWREGGPSHYSPMSVEEAENTSLRLLEATSEALLATSKEIGPLGHLTELDMHDDSSVLLECALKRVSHNSPIDSSHYRVRFNTPPLISEVPPPPVVTAQIYGMWLRVMFVFVLMFEVSSCLLHSQIK